MSEKQWIPPVELELEAEPSKPQEQSEPLSPTVLAEEGEEKFEAYVREGERIDEPGKAPGLGAIPDAQTGALERRVSQRRRRAFQWLLGSAGVLLAGVLVLDAYSFLETLFGRSVVLGAIFTILFALLVASLVVVVQEQVRDIRRLRDISRLQSEAERLRQANGYGAASALTARLSALYRHRADVEPGLEIFRTAVSDAHTDAEVLELFTKHVLQPLDERASRIVTSYASQTALLTALSPLALLDAMLSLWRSVRMAREIAVLYEGRPGPLGTLSLVRDIAGTLAAAGASELIADAGAEAFGSTFAATLSAKVGQGMAMGILTIRVGLAAMRLCRPLPFQEEERPRIAQIRDQVFKAIYRAVNAGKQKP